MRSVYALALLPLLAAAANIPIPKKDWSFTADSEQAGNEIAKAFDGDVKTFWITKTKNPKRQVDESPDSGDSMDASAAVGALPHKVTINMKKLYVVNGFEYIPRQDGSTDGFPGVHSIEVSKDSKTWTKVAYGTMVSEGNRVKITRFTDIPAQYVRFTATSEVNGKKTTSAAEINILSPDPKREGTQFTALSTQKGKWEHTVVFPLVPVAIGLMPDDKLLTWSAYKVDVFENGTGKTMTATWDTRGLGVTAETVTKTDHDMFCPGLSLDETNRFVVAGGNNGKTTSIYKDGKWTRFADMKISRGYQSQTTLSDGRAFTIGGSYTDPAQGKNGEVYDPKKNEWRLLPKALVKPMLTDDHEGIYRSDNHAWLFAWKWNSVFQAGPSKAMNWYRTDGDGDTKPAGLRGQDNHSMNGVAVMYDAVAGKILTVGGSPEYENGTATANAHIITLGEIEDPVKVEKISSMSYPRGFHNGVVLPNGQVVVVGGMDYLVPFSDVGAAMTPELWDPVTKKFTSLNPIATGRTYHSTALLLRDGTVFSGGGGLCGDCVGGNHMDGQVLSPPYLFNADGSKATRPVIKSVTLKTMTVGTHFNVQTDGPVTAFTLMRFGSATHSINTDQRRIPLTFEKINDGPNMYRMMTPYDRGILLTGPYMLFALNAQGTPSMGEVINIKLAN